MSVLTHLECVLVKFLLCYWIIIMFLLPAHGCCLLFLGKAKELGFVAKSLVCLSSECFVFLTNRQETHEGGRAVWGVSRHGMLCSCKLLAQAIECFIAALGGASGGAGHCAGLQCTVPKADAWEEVGWDNSLSTAMCVGKFRCWKHDQNLI